MTATPPEVDRLLLASFQPDTGRAAVALARAFVKALARVKVREGALVAQLDELLGTDQALVEGVPFLPDEPVCLCLTGTPRLVAAVAFGLGSVTKARFARVRPPAAVECLRVAAAARDGAVTLDGHRELAAVDLAPLAKAGWRVERAASEEPVLALLAAEALLEGVAAVRPTPWAPPAPAPCDGRT